MNRIQSSFRLPTITKAQLADLLGWTGLNRTEIIREAVSRMWREERLANPSTSMPDPVEK